MSSKKDEIREFLQTHNVPFETTDTKRMLIDIVKNFVEDREEQFRRRAIDDLCRENGMKLIRLPPYHASFNPIEFVWGWVKSEVRKIVNVTDSIHEIKARTLEIMDRLPRRHIEAFFRHVTNVENELDAFDNCHIDLNSIIDDDNQE
ncbi:hypothetical protein L596_028781 [Steinernema carpocapsae]|uniref:Tc1-like transposase DDE domain-containing protein n=1 Tax=Steinernema carpocapsae TaxID=34508 RepID=A0A4U5LZC2_STECR|nr:hypothetical protein L596_028781 [Steinernema carpocapsae]